jgi:predicted nucleic acid-binding protein
MPVFLLDTNIISELRHGKPQQNSHVREWAAGQPMVSLYVSAITVLELEKGVVALEHKTPPQGRALRHWLDRVKLGFAGRILPFTDETAEWCAALHQPQPRPERDAMIAATALQHRMTLVTRNVGDFSGMRLALINPFEAAGG